MNDESEEAPDATSGQACSTAGPCAPCGAGKALIVAVLVVAVIAVILAKGRRGKEEAPPTPGASATAPAATPAEPVTPQPQKALPRLVDLGADKCIPCKAMAPILDGLREEYKGRLDVVFIDVWKEPEAGKAYGIRVIPTQIFFDASGKELFRHEGFFSKEDILAKWKALGVDVARAPDATPADEAAATSPDAGE